MDIHNNGVWRLGEHAAAASELDSAGPPLFTELKVDTKANVVEAAEPAGSVNLLEEVSTAFHVLRDAMYLTCALHNTNFREPEELHICSMRSRSESLPTLCWETICTISDAVVTMRARSTTGSLQFT